MRKIFNWIIDKWLAGFITASIFFLLKQYSDLPDDSKIHFFSLNWLTELLKIKISLSTVILIVVVLIIVTRIEKSLIQRKFNKKNNENDFWSTPKNDFAFYCKDSFGVNKTIWKWDYRWDVYKRSFLITNLNPCCPNCGIIMETDHFHGSSASCHKCRLENRNSHFRVTENIDDVEKEIIRRITSNEVLVK